MWAGEAGLPPVPAHAGWPALQVEQQRQQTTGCKKGHWLVWWLPFSASSCRLVSPAGAFDAAALSLTAENKIAAELLAVQTFDCHRLGTQDQFLHMGQARSLLHMLACRKDHRLAV